MKYNQHEQLFTELIAEFEAPAFTELDDETGAAIEGGANLELYDTDDFKQLLGSFNSGGKPRLIHNDQISSIIVREGQWRLYADANYKGYAQTYGPDQVFIFTTPGKYVLPPGLNNKVSSFQRVD
ncbi:MAG: hypothetical protein SAL70_22390 [Scytonema sp. PMC 1070.18]|nr:hypothetical protein [Scytonema sp. PMC 1070.18]